MAGAEQVPISIIDAQIEGLRLNNKTALDATALLKAVKNAVAVSKAKGHKTIGGLTHDLYVENYRRRIGTDSIFRLCCSIYADALQQEIGIHLLASDDGEAMWKAEQKGSLLEFYLTYGSGENRATP